MSVTLYKLCLLYYCRRCYSRIYFKIYEMSIFTKELVMDINRLTALFLSLLLLGTGPAAADVLLIDSI